MEEYITKLLIFSGIVLLGGFGCLIFARINDRKNYIIQKATPMPLSLVNERDDVWLKGEAECASPVTAPEFGHSCLYFNYTLKRKETRKVKDSKGNTRTETRWVTVKNEKKAADFNLVEGNERISIHGDDADFRDLESDSRREGKYEHSVYYYPYPSHLNAVGSVSEKKARLESYENIPLFVTSKEREDYIQDAEKFETLLRVAGLLLIWVGLTGAAYGVLDHNSYPFQSAGQFHWQMLGMALIPATLIAFMIWTIHIYNRFVIHRNRIENAWRQVDVDLAMRYQLIPQLFNVVKGYMKHEKELLIQLAKLRNKAIAATQEGKVEIEGQMLGSMKKIIARVENYPELKAEPVMQKLNRELRAIEEKIAHGRTVYNEAVLEYNDVIQEMPNVLVASLIGLKPKTYFDLTLS